MFKVNTKNTFPSVSVIEFKQVNVSWAQVLCLLRASSRRFKA